MRPLILLSLLLSGCTLSVPSSFQGGVDTAKKVVERQPLFKGGDCVQRIGDLNKNLERWERRSIMQMQVLEIGKANYHTTFIGHDTDGLYFTYGEMSEDFEYMDSGYVKFACPHIVGNY